MQLSPRTPSGSTPAALGVRGLVSRAADTLAWGLTPSPQEQELEDPQEELHLWAGKGQVALLGKPMC